MENPFDQINYRFNILEALIHDIRNRLGMINPNERITRKQITTQYKVSLGTIHNAMNNGDLPFDKVGSRTLFKKSDVERWVSKK